MHGCQDIGPDYAVTLRAWADAWVARRAEVLALGYSERFWRKYLFYFQYCGEAASRPARAQKPELACSLAAAARRSSGRALQLGCCCRQPGSQAARPGVLLDAPACGTRCGKARAG